MSDHTRDFNQVVRAWAHETHGWHGAAGGWIYDQRGRAIRQGWGSIFHSWRREVLDWVTRRETAFSTFRELVEETAPIYRPTLFQTNAYRRFLSDQYDLAQRARGDSRRTFRGSRNAA